MNGTARARVVVLAGPSGSGKSRLAARLHGSHGWPVVRLDDFYRDGGDPRLPMRELGGTRLVDWDDPGSWDADAALSALRVLVVDGSSEVPRYDIARSMAVGTDRVSVRSGQLVLAEGIFAAEIIGRLGDEGLLHSAWCVRHQRWLTFVLRLVRDLSERRKAPHILVRRGLALCRNEPQVIARMVRLGARSATPRQTERAFTLAGTAGGGVA